MTDQELISELVHIISALVKQLGISLEQGGKVMALGQDILDAVTAESTAVDGIITLINRLVATSVVPAATGQAILAAIASDKTKLEAAILANTPAGP